MPKFRVKIELTHYTFLDIEADNKAEAIEKASEKFQECDERSNGAWDIPECLTQQMGEDGKWFFPE